MTEPAPRSGAMTAPDDRSAPPTPTPARGPRVLVSAASRHGSTREIAAAIARWLPETPAGRSTGLTTGFLPVDQDADPAGFDAVVFGSAVHVGRWLESARHWVSTSAGSLRRRPVWLFSSGPIGEPPFPPDEPYDLAAVVPLVEARGTGSSLVGCTNDR